MGLGLEGLEEPCSRAHHATQTTQPYPHHHPTHKRAATATQPVLLDICPSLAGRVQPQPPRTAIDPHRKDSNYLSYPVDISLVTHQPQPPKKYARCQEYP